MIAMLDDWRPQQEVTEHSGEPLPADAFFFVSPPTEIGEVVTAHSSVRRGKPLEPTGWRLLLAGGLTAVGDFIIWLVLHSDTEIGSLLMWMLLFSVPAFLITFLVSKRTAVCSYAGSLGIARFRLKRDPDKTRRPEIFLFQNAVELRTSQTRHYTNGVYTGTNYEFIWSNFQGKTCYKLTGSYYSSDGKPDKESPYYYALGAEGAWSAFAFERAKAELANHGVVRFNLPYGNYLVIGDGFIDLCFKGQTAHCPTHEIDRVTIKQGVITLRRTDAKSGFFGIGSSGIFTFDYAGLANARVFLFLLDHLVGVDFS